MSTARDPRSPCLIGVNRHTWHASDVGEAGAPEPLFMWESVARAAAEDSGAAKVIESLDSVRIVYCQGWQYDDPVARLAERLGNDPAHRQYSGIGGTMPQLLVSEAANAIQVGESDLSMVVGAEALATIRRLKKAGRRPEWSFKPAERRPFPFDIPFHPAEVAHSVFEAYLTFAIFESARRAHLGHDAQTHAAEMGGLMAPLTKVAAASPEHAWFPIERSPQEITVPTADNRLVAYPYTKLMTSIMDVDMASAVILASEGKADELGVPADRRVYLRGWAYAEDPYYVAERRELWRSSAMRVTSEAALGAAGIGIDDVAHLDLYSCFASSVGFAADALGLTRGDARSLTVTGGLPYHGGPGSNYMTHSIAAMAETLRGDPGSFGLVSGVGMHMTKHIYAVWSTTPGTLTPPDPTALTELVREDTERAPIVDTYSGEATVAAYSVLHGKSGEPESGVLVCDVPGGARSYARMEDPAALVAGESEDLVGQAVQLTTNESVNFARR